MIRLLSLFFLLLLPLSAQRVALVVGNRSYEHGGILPNAINDALMVTACLEESGFDVIKATNLRHEDFEEQLLAFGKKAKSAEAALFYFAGHGLEVGGVNYLVPIDAKVEKEFQVKHRAVSMEEVLGTLAEADAQLKLVYLDCCRNNPLGRSFRRDGAGGLGVPQDVPEGTVLIYATAPKKVAFDGEDNNSPFTKAFVASMAKGLSIEDHYKALALQVRTKTEGEQQPWMNTNFTGRFSFLGKLVTAEAGGMAEKSDQSPAPPSVAPKLGRWRVIEKVVEEHGGYLIVWEYLVEKHQEELVWTGRKAMVNGQTPTKGEKAARSVMKVMNVGGEWRGARVETNHRGEVLRGVTQVTFSEDGASFSGAESQGGETNAKLRGSWQGKE